MTRETTAPRNSGFRADPLIRQLRTALAEGGCVLHADPRRDLSTQWLQAQRAGFEQVRWQRDTSLGDRRADVRLTMLAKTAADVHTWRQNLNVPSDAETLTRLTDPA